MNSMGVWATLAVLLLFIATVKAAEGGVEFWRKTFTMTCPQSGNWFRKGKEVQAKRLQDNEKSIQDDYDVCENCFELDSFVVGLAIVVDVLGTAFVMMVIYKYTKKKYSAGLSQVSKAPARSAGHAPPNPDTYEVATESSHPRPGAIRCPEQDGIKTSHLSALGHCVGRVEQLQLPRVASRVEDEEVGGVGHQLAVLVHEGDGGRRVGPYQGKEDQGEAWV
ncbi:hypothetical protein FQN60_004647 [Etheostoma spectabile]|uniref:CD3 gamma/delta subunit Ig-like domain-containing protein n=1 Tax=Etheostoma spectabile TaxID=54343 RepID=A0A5J5DKM0_9PERO|nr:hypothetical protein FQN60_004647 [Etheostoma spectabile]